MRILPKKSMPVVALLLVLALTVALVGSTTAASVEPVFVDGNPTCEGLGYAYGFKVDAPEPGTYSIDGRNSATVSGDGVHFDWSTTIGMDAVIAKGGPNANVYVYDPPAESSADTSLHSPINPSNGQPFGLSHIEFCYDYELTASKTANPSYTRTYTWEIDKSVSPASHIGFAGDTFRSNYDVTVDQTVTDSDFTVSGNITVNNPTPFTVGFSVSDLINGTPAIVNCPTNSLAPGASTTCTYSAGLSAKIDGTNTATVTSTTANVGGATASAPYIFGDPTTVVGLSTVNVTDTLQGALGPVSGDHTFKYSRDFRCSTDPANYGNTYYSYNENNTAEIVETGQSDSERVAVSCYAPMVTKDATTAYTNTWNWTIDKSADQAALTLSAGQQFLVAYDVTVSALDTESGWTASGEIEVYNPAPIPATFNGVNDIVSPDVAASVDCGVTFPYSLPSAENITCTYSVDLANADTRVNTATATLQNYAYDAQGAAAAYGTTNFSGTASVDFTGATVTEVDECIDVSDTYNGSLGTVCANQAPRTFSYSRQVGPYAACGDYTVENIASFISNDTSATGSDSWTVSIDVPCVTGCTLTQGYWKTHSAYGPAPYDDAWSKLGEDTTFFSSGKTYYHVLWTPPQGGNVYYQLAHQYIAAKLNVLNGASTNSTVSAAINAATSLFNTYSPAQVGEAKGKGGNDLRAQFTYLASLLDQYNNGLIGPGHCSE